MADKRAVVAIAGRLLVVTASLALLSGIWAMAAAVAQSRVLPTPGTVLAFLWAEAADGALWVNLGMTLFRVALAFAVAMAVGSAIGILMGLNRFTDRLFDPWLVLLLNLPALVIMVLAYIWFGLTEAAAVGAVALAKIPNVVVVMREGTRALDPAMSEMAKVFRFPPARQLRHVVLPQLQPYFAATTRSGIALIWKIVLVVELLGRPNGVGFQIYTYFQLFDVRAIVGYSLAFVVVMLLVEFFALQPFEASATRWRKRGA